jgi:LPXTG-site transpeptidase (sortase) family protein
MTVTRPQPMLQRLQWTLLVVGMVSLGWCGIAVGKARWFQARQHAALERVSSVKVPRANTPDTPIPSAVVSGGVIGELNIPGLNVSVVVVEGDDEATLNVAVGHLPDTPLPWETGNSALAGHRDTFFRALEHVRFGDEIRLTTTHGQLRYRVERTRVVEPDDLSVLEPSPTSRLTLITCFPFSYIGHAPQRFIVQAEQIRTTARSNVSDALLEKVTSRRLT